jgi:hypothetical protein
MVLDSTPFKPRNLHTFVSIHSNPSGLPTHYLFFLYLGLQFRPLLNYATPPYSMLHQPCGTLFPKIVHPPFSPVSFTYPPLAPSTHISKPNSSPLTSQNRTLPSYHILILLLLHNTPAIITDFHRSIL